MRCLNQLLNVAVVAVVFKGNPTTCCVSFLYLKHFFFNRPHNTVHVIVISDQVLIMCAQCLLECVGVSWY